MTLSESIETSILYISFPSFDRINLEGVCLGSLKNTFFKSTSIPLWSLKFSNIIKDELPFLDIAQTGFSTSPIESLEFPKMTTLSPFEFSKKTCIGQEP